VALSKRSQLALFYCSVPLAWFLTAGPGAGFGEGHDKPRKTSRVRAGRRAVVFTTGSAHFGTFWDVSAVCRKVRKLLLLCCFLRFCG
jgi:hypothetical protein